MPEPIIYMLLSFLGTSCVGLVLYIFTRQTAQTDRATDRNDTRADRTAEKQGTQGELMAGVLARIGQLEADRSKIADALDRLARLEEFRIHAMPKLEEAEATARSFVAVQEQLKTVFKRLDAIPGEVVELLKLHIRATPQRSPA
jgi:hypothetical protein